METKTHWKKLENLDYIGAYSLNQGEDKVVTIEKVFREIVVGSGGKKEECTIAKLKGEKPFILNRTNMKTIQKVLGSPYIEDWKEQSITLFTTKITAFGEPIECLRVRPTRPQIRKAEFTPEHERWEGAKKAIKEGNATVEDIKKSFNLSPVNEKLLLS